MIDRSGRAVVLGFFVGLVVVTGLLGAVLGYAVPARTGLEETTLFSRSLPITPLSFALYGAVSVGAGLGVALVVVAVAARFDERA